MTAVTRAAEIDHARAPHIPVMQPRLETSPTPRTARRRALLLGCGGGSLRGVSRSLAALADELAARRFSLATCGPAATADELLVALATFVRGARPGDTVVIVYVGHGVLLEHADHPRDPDSPRHVQALLPVDHAASHADDCRALTGLDLGLALRHLAARADNVTLVLDCCHAAGLVAEPGSLRDAADSPWHSRLRAALGERLAATRGELDEVVRLVGCATHEHAYETSDSEGGWIGLLSRTLAEVLAETRELALTWADVAAAVHARVREIRPEQWIGLEGPRTRGVFTRADLSPPFGGYPISATSPTTLEIPAGRLHGVHPGDRFAVVAADGAVLRVSPVTSITATTACLAGSDAPIGARAVCVRHCRPVGVSVTARDERDAAWLRPLLRRAGCTPGAHAHAADVHLVDGEVHVMDPDDGAPLLRARCDVATDAVVRVLQRLADWRRVRAAFVHASPGVDVVATTTRGDGPPRPLSAAALTSADTLHLQLSNAGRLAPLIHCAVFRVTSSRVIVPLTRDAHGVPLQVGEAWQLGRHEWSRERTRGLPVTPALPGVRTEWLLIVGQPAPLTAHWLETATASPMPTIMRDSAPRPPWCMALPYRVRGLDSWSNTDAASV